MSKSGTSAEGARRRDILAVAAGAAAALAGPQAIAADAPPPASPAPAGPPGSAPGVKIDARMVPWPSTISPQARAFLAGAVAPDGSPFPRPRMPPADDRKAWAALKLGVTTMLMKMASRLPAPAATTETIQMGGATVYVATPKTLTSDAHAYLEIHGGGFVHGGGEFAALGGRKAAALHGVRSYSVDYRSPPEHPAPAALDDCVAVYRELLKRYKPQNIIVGGGSAGGNLTAALGLRVRDEGLPPPAALVLMTPATDMTFGGDTIETNKVVDVVLGGSNLDQLRALYIGGQDPRHPYLSPLFGDFAKGFPPTFLQSGTRDLLLSDTVRLHTALHRAGVPAELHVYEGMPHGGFWGAPEDDGVNADVARFVAAHWGRKGKGSA
jgi:monoterpene epsilon-lactone hydrolase